MAVMPVTRASLLVRLRSAEDAPAWAEFLRIYGPAVFSYYRRHGLQEADAVDLTQEVFAELARRLRQFDYRPERGRFRAWMFKVVRWRLSKFARAKRRDPAGAADAPAVEVPDRTDDGLTWRNEVRARLVRAALDDIRPTVAESTFAAFRLTAVEGLSGDEAAKVLGVSRAAVYLAKVRIMAKLRRRVAELDAGEAGE